MIESNGIRLNIAEQGQGPLVLLCHGFPESWYSWRHQIDALAAAGFHAVAPDMRGYGKSDRPEAIDQYTIFHLIGDLVGLLDALKARPPSSSAMTGARPSPGMRRACGPTASAPSPASASRSGRAARCPRPASCRAPRTRNSISCISRSPASPRPSSSAIRALTVRTMLYGASGEGAAASRAAAASGGAAPNVGMVPRGGGMLRAAATPATLPPWLSEADMDFYAGEFKRSGFRGPLNYYRNIDRNWELMAPFADVKVTVPALFVAGDHDLVVAVPRDRTSYLANIKKVRPRAARDQDAARLRSLDPAGAPRRGQRRDHRIPARSLPG